jgi:hypothetical protein
MLNRITPDMTLDRPNDSRFSRTLRVTYRPGGMLAEPPYLKTLKHGWQAFWVSHYGTERTVVTYRKTPA